MRTVVTSEVAIYNDSSAKENLFGKRSKTETIDAWSSESSGTMSIDASGVESVPLGDVEDPRFLYLEADGDFNLKLNGGSEILAIKLADTNVGRKARVMLDVDFTSASITNTSSSDVLSIIYCIAGD